METLTKKEEDVMQILWNLKKGFVKDIISQMSKDSTAPPYNTISSVVRILVKKGFVEFKQYGNTYEYFPKISKKKYKKTIFKTLISNYFDGSLTQLASFMVKENKLDNDEVKKLLKIIEENEDKK